MNRSGAGSTFGTDSPPIPDSEPMGVSNVKGDKPKGVSDAKQREQYFEGSQSEQNSASDVQTNVVSGDKVKKD